MDVESFAMHPVRFTGAGEGRVACSAQDWAVSHERWKHRTPTHQPVRHVERVERLRDEGVFRGFHAEIEPAVMGIGLQALVVVRLRRHAEDEVQRFWEHAEAMPETKAIYHLAGANDFLCHVVVKDPDHLRRVAVDSSTGRSPPDRCVQHHQNHPTQPDMGSHIAG